MGRENSVERAGMIRHSRLHPRVGHSIQGQSGAMVPRNAARVFSRTLFSVSGLDPARLLAAVTILVIVSVVLPARAGEGLDDKDIVLEPDNPAIVELGRGVYESHCASCHGKQLEGQAEWRVRLDNGMLPAPPHDKTGHTWHHADDLLFEITKYGMAKVIDNPQYLTMMPVFESVLEDKDIIAVLSFIKSTWLTEEREWQEKVNKAQ